MVTVTMNEEEYENFVKYCQTGKHNLTVVVKKKDVKSLRQTNILEYININN